MQTMVVAGTSNKRCAMVSGTTQVCNGNYGYNGWLGLASINISGPHITQGTAKLNDSYFSSATYNNPSEKLHVMCQEVAHTYGLGHTSEDGSSQNTCMDYYQNKTDDGISTKPNQHDFDMLNSIYAHLDSITTVSTTSAATAGQSDVTEDPNSWGSLMSQSRNGRSSTYQRANSDGTHTITHVFWTERRQRVVPCTITATITTIDRNLSSILRRCVSRKTRPIRVLPFSFRAINLVLDVKHSNLRHPASFFLRSQFSP